MFILEQALEEIMELATGQIESIQADLDGLQGHSARTKSAKKRPKPTAEKEAKKKRLTTAASQMISSEAREADGE